MTSEYDASFLSLAVADTRRNIDEPIISAKYSTADIIRQLEASYSQILGELNRNTKTPVVLKPEITVGDGIYNYELPPIIASVYAVYEQNENGYKVFFDSRGRFNQYGRGIWIEGKTLCVQNPADIGVGTILTIECLPLGTARLHNGVCTISVAGDKVTLAATPNAGTLDTHQNAYAGSILRIIKVSGAGATGDYIQERIITDYDNTTRVATLKTALTPKPVAGTNGSIFYEIAPAINQGLDSIIAAYTAYYFISLEGNQKRAISILALYRDQIRHLRLTAYYSNLQEASVVHGDDYRNRRYRNY